MKPQIIGDMHPLFNHAFNFTYKSTTVFYAPNDGFYIVLFSLENNAYTTKRGYFKASIFGLIVTLYFDNAKPQEINLNEYPIYYFSETIPTN